MYMAVRVQGTSVYMCAKEGLGFYVIVTEVEALLVLSEYTLTHTIQQVRVDNFFLNTTDSTSPVKAFCFETDSRSNCSDYTIEMTNTSHALLSTGYDTEYSRCTRSPFS
jgi:hypothetical protein